MKNYDNNPDFQAFLAHEKQAEAHIHTHPAPEPQDLSLPAAETPSHFKFYAGCAAIGALLTAGNTLIIAAPMLEEAAKSADFYWFLLRFALAGAFTACLIGGFVRLCKKH